MVSCKIFLTTLNWKCPRESTERQTGSSSLLPGPTPASGGRPLVPPAYSHFSVPRTSSRLFSYMFVKQLVPTGCGGLSFLLKVKAGVQDIKNIKLTNYVSSGFISIVFFFLLGPRQMDSERKRCHLMPRSAKSRERKESGRMSQLPAFQVTQTVCCLPSTMPLSSIQRGSVVTHMSPSNT